MPVDIKHLVFLEMRFTFASRDHFVQNMDRFRLQWVGSSGSYRAFAHFFSVADFFALAWLGQLLHPYYNGYTCIRLGKITIC